MRKRFIMVAFMKMNRCNKSCNRVLLIMNKSCRKYIIRSFSRSIHFFQNLSPFESLIKKLNKTHLNPWYTADTRVRLRIYIQYVIYCFTLRRKRLLNTDSNISQLLNRISCLFGFTSEDTTSRKSVPLKA